VSLAVDADLIIGVDTHLDTHIAAVCDARGRAVSQLQVPATAAGYTQLLAWVRSAAGDCRAVWAVEGTRHYGLGLARYLAARGQQVAEIDNTRHVGKRRAGKSHPIDAVRAARELLARPHAAQMRADGDREALRLLMVDWDNAVSRARLPAPCWPPSWLPRQRSCASGSGDCRAPGGRSSARRWPARSLLTGRPGCCTRP
jgi:transposase